MAHSLSGERPHMAAVTLNPFRIAARWYDQTRKARAQRAALGSLFNLDADRLSDLGINRSDLFDAMHAERDALKSERDALKAFKSWVHKYLDDHGVPHHPPGTHGAAGCRIGDRMDWVMARIVKEQS